jgi:hypothetical protein
MMGWLKLLVLKKSHAYQNVTAAHDVTRAFAEDQERRVFGGLVAATQIANKPTQMSKESPIIPMLRLIKTINP